jgi:uncharacterized protein YcnI
VATLAVAAAVLPTLSWAHAVVYPKVSAPGAYEKYVLRVPNEKAVPTTRVELRVPPGVRVTSFADVPGWRLEVVTDSANAVTAAVWTGSLPPRRFVEFPFVAVNPRAAGRIAWPASQTYADTLRVDWAGPEGSKAPASVTTITAEAAPAGGAAPAEGGYAKWLPWVAVVLSLLSLGLAMRKPEARTSV